MHLFGLTHEWVFDGGRIPKQGQKDKEVRSGYWRLNMLPAPGPLHEQCNYTLEALSIIRRKMNEVAGRG